jgi:hypothetical protein
MKVYTLLKENSIPVPKHYFVIRDVNDDVSKKCILFNNFINIIIIYFKKKNIIKKIFKRKRKIIE